MPPRRSLAALAAAPLLALTACSDGPFAAIGPLAGEHFMLTQVNGQPLPAVVWAEPAGARLELVGETLEFRPLFRVARARTLRYTAANGTVETTTQRQLTYYQVGGVYQAQAAASTSAAGLPLRVGSLSPCPTPPGALSVACEPAEPGVVHGDELQLTRFVHGATSATVLALRFARYDPSDVVPMDGTGP